jgi:hypothetical protein
MNINSITNPKQAVEFAVQLILSERKHPNRNYKPITVSDIEARIKAYPGIYKIFDGDWQTYLPNAEADIDRALSEVKGREAGFKFDSREGLF